MKVLKNSFFFFFFLLVGANAFAQNELVKITGLLSQKRYAEISVLTNIGGLKRTVATAVVDLANNKFSFAVPYQSDASYQLQVTVMKMGHLRLERDYVVNSPIQLTPKQDLFITLNPALFVEKTPKGISIEKKTAKFTTAAVSGKLKNWTYGGEFLVEKVVEGRLEKVEAFNVEKSNPSFNFLIPVGEEGFYYLSNTRWRKRLYLKPGDHIELNVDGASGVQTDWIKTTEENRILAGWTELINPATGYGYNLLQQSKAIVDAEAFRSAYQSIQPKILTFLQAVNTANVNFNRLFKTAAQLDNSLLAMRSLLNLAGKKHLFWLPAKEFSNVPDYYKQIVDQNRISSSDLLRFGEGNEYINLFAKFSLDKLSEDRRRQIGDAEKLRLMMSAISNETLKAFLLKSQLEELNVNNYSEFRNAFLPFEKYAKPASVKWKYNKVLEQFAPDTAFIGKSAYDFILPDVTGKPVSMKDFKGKVVLIDVWATWCGPCKAQMPFLKEVEEMYHGNNNIIFVGISVDSEQNKQKWLDMIKEKGLDGMQLLDNSGKSFAKKYKIAAIPRFLLIDKKGNWVEVRCPLPEDKIKLKAYIDRELGKGS